MNLFILIDSEASEDSLEKGPGPYGFKTQPKVQAGPKQSFKVPGGKPKPKPAAGGPKLDAKAGNKAFAAAGARASTQAPKGGAEKPPATGSAATEGEGLGEGYVAWKGKGDPPPDSGWEQYTTKNGNQGYKRPKGYVGTDDTKESTPSKEQDEPEPSQDTQVDPEDASDPLKEEDGTDVGTEDLTPDTGEPLNEEDSVPLTEIKEESAVPLTREKEQQPKEQEPQQDGDTNTPAEPETTAPEESTEGKPSDVTQPEEDQPDQEPKTKKEKKVRTTSDEIKEAKNKVTDLSRENKELKRTLKAVESDLSSAEKKIKSLDNKIEQKTKKLKEAQKKTNKSVLRLSERKIASRERKIRDLQARIDRDSAKNKTLSDHQKSVLAKNKEDLSTAKKELSSLKDDHKKLKSSIEKADKDVEKLTAELKEHQSEKSTEEKKLSDTKREHSNVSSSLEDNENQAKEATSIASLSVPESDLEKLEHSSHTEKASKQLQVIDEHLALDPDNEGLQQLRNIYEEQSNIDHVPTKEDKDALKRADNFSKERGVLESPQVTEESIAEPMTTDQQMEHGIHTQKSVARANKIAKILEENPEHPQREALEALKSVFDEQGALEGPVSGKDKAAVRRAEAYAAANGIDLDEPVESETKSKPERKGDKKARAMSAFRSGRGAGEVIAAATNKPEGGGDVADILTYGSQGVIGAGSKLLGGDNNKDKESSTPTESEPNQPEDKTLTEVQDVEDQGAEDSPRRPEKQKMARRTSNRETDLSNPTSSEGISERDSDVPDDLKLNVNRDQSRESNTDSDELDIPENMKEQGSWGKTRKPEEATRKSMKLYVSMNKAIGPRPNVSINSTKLDEQKEADSEEMSSTGMVGTSGDPTDLPGNGRKMNEKGKNSNKSDKLVIKKSSCT